jgi:hypothetical protein
MPFIVRSPCVTDCGVDREKFFRFFRSILGSKFNSLPGSKVY